MSHKGRRTPLLMLLLLLSACGGGGGDGGGMAPPPPPGPVGSGDAFTDQVAESAAHSSEDGEPIDIDTLALTQPEDAEPTTLQ